MHARIPAHGISIDVIKERTERQFDGTKEKFKNKRVKDTMLAQE